MLPFMPDHAGICAATGLQTETVASHLAASEQDPGAGVFPLKENATRAGPARCKVLRVDPPGGSRLGFELVAIYGSFPALRDDEMRLVHVSFGHELQRPLHCSPTRILCLSVPVSAAVSAAPIAVSLDGGHTFTSDEVAYEYTNSNILHVDQAGSHVVHWGMTSEIANAWELPDVELYHSTLDASSSAVKPHRLRRLKQRLTGGAQSLGGARSSSSAGMAADQSNFKISSGSGGHTTNSGHAPHLAPAPHVVPPGKPAWVETKYPGFVTRQQIAIDAFLRENLRVSDRARPSRQALLAHGGNGLAALNDLVNAFVDSAGDKDVNLQTAQEDILHAVKAQIAALQVQGMPIKHIACSETSAVVLLDDGRLVSPVYRTRVAPGRKGADAASEIPEMLTAGWLTLDTASRTLRKLDLATQPPPSTEMRDPPELQQQLHQHQGSGWLRPMRKRTSHHPLLRKDAPAAGNASSSTSASARSGGSRANKVSAALQFFASRESGGGVGGSESAALNAESAGVEVVMLPPLDDPVEEEATLARMGPLDALDREAAPAKEESPDSRKSASANAQGLDMHVPSGNNTVRGLSDAVELDVNTQSNAWVFGETTNSSDANHAGCPRALVFPRFQQVVRVAAGANHFGAITDDLHGAQLYTWGSNSHGQLGLGVAVGEFVFAPKLVELGSQVGGPAERQVRRFACGANTSICAALDAKGRSALFAWGATGFETATLVSRVLRSGSKLLLGDEGSLATTFPHSMRHLDACQARAEGDSSGASMVASAPATAFDPVKCFEFRSTSGGLDVAASVKQGAFWDPMLDRWLLAVEDEATASRSSVPYFVESDKAHEELSQLNKMEEALDLHVQMYRSYVDDLERAMDLKSPPRHLEPDDVEEKDVVLLKVRGLLRTISNASDVVRVQLESIAKRHASLEADRRASQLDAGRAIKAARHAKAPASRLRYQEVLLRARRRGDKLSADIGSLQRDADLLLEQYELLRDQKLIFEDLAEDWNSARRDSSVSLSPETFDELDMILQLVDDLQASQLTTDFARPHGSQGSCADAPQCGSDDGAPSFGRNSQKFKSGSEVLCESTAAISAPALGPSARQTASAGLRSLCAAMESKVSDIREAVIACRADPSACKDGSQQLLDLACDLAEQKHFRTQALMQVVEETEKIVSGPLQAASHHGTTTDHAAAFAPLRIGRVESPLG